MSAGRQLGLWWGGVAAGLLALSPLGPHLASALPICLFKAVTGVPCATCGTTRAALALARLDVAGALAVNPLAALAWMALVAGGLAAGALALAGRGVPRLAPPPVWARMTAVAAVLANWGYLIARGT